MNILTDNEKQTLIDHGYVNWLAENGYKDWLANNGYNVSNSRNIDQLEIDLTLN